MPGQLLNPRTMTAKSTKIDLYLIAEEDIPYEEELIRNPYTLKPWLHYLQIMEDVFRSSSTTPRWSKSCEIRGRIR